MTAALLRVRMESGQIWDDPSEDLLFELLSDMERGEEQFLIVERVADATGQTFAQVARTDAGGYQVEYREGEEDRHFQALTEDKRLVHSVITLWAFELPGWQDALPWAPCGSPTTGRPYRYGLAGQPITSGELGKHSCRLSSLVNAVQRLTAWRRPGTGGQLGRQKREPAHLIAYADVRACQSVTGRRAHTIGQQQLDLVPLAAGSFSALASVGSPHRQSPSVAFWS